MKEYNIKVHATLCICGMGVDWSNVGSKGGLLTSTLSKSDQWINRKKPLFQGANVENILEMGGGG